MTLYIHENAVLANLIHLAESRNNPDVKPTPSNCYLNILIPHYSLLTKEQQKKVRDLCLIISGKVKGGKERFEDLEEINIIKSYPNFDLIQKDLAQDIEQWGTGKGNDIIHRYIQSSLWNVNLLDNYLEKVNDKTTYTVKGWIVEWLLQQTIQYPNITTWLNKRLLVTYNKNSPHENIDALLQLDISTLNTTEFPRFWNTVSHVFSKQINDITSDEVLFIHRKISAYFDTLNIQDIPRQYEGIPDKFLHTMPFEDESVQKYALNRFFLSNPAAFGWTKAHDIPYVLFENNRLRKEQSSVEQKKCHRNLLEYLSREALLHNTLIPELHFKYGSQGYKTLYTVVFLIKLKEIKFSGHNSGILPLIKVIGDEWNIKTDTLIATFVGGGASHDVMTMINATFKSFLTLVVEKMHTYSAVYDITSELTTKLMLWSKTASFGELPFSKNNYAHLIDVYNALFNDNPMDLSDEIDIVLS